MNEVPPSLPVTAASLHSHVSLHGSPLRSVSIHFFYRKASKGGFICFCPFFKVSYETIPSISGAIYEAEQFFLMTYVACCCPPRCTYHPASWPEVMVRLRHSRAPFHCCVRPCSWFGSGSVRWCIAAPESRKISYQARRIAVDL